MKRLLLAILLVLLMPAAGAAPSAILHLEAKASMEDTYPAVYAALEERRFWVVFEADLGANLAGFAERWGADYNRNGLEAIRSMVVCNGWYANQVSNADPQLLALCPLRVNLYQKDDITHILFARPTRIAADSPGLALVQEIEDLISAALQDAVVAAEGR